MYVNESMGLEGVGWFLSPQQSQAISSIPTAGSGGGFENVVNTLTNLLSTATKTIDKVSTTVNAVKGGSGQGGGITYVPPSNSQPESSFLQQHGGKLLLGGLALGVGILTVRALSTKKKK